MATASRAPELAGCRRIIEERLKCALPPLAIRRRIYEQAAKAFVALQGGEQNLPVTLMGLSTWANIWVFLVGNFGGAALAALTYRLVNGGE